MCFWHFLQASARLLGKACLRLQGHWGLNKEPVALPMLPASPSSLWGCWHAQCPCQGILGNLRESLCLSLHTSLLTSGLVAFDQISTSKHREHSPKAPRKRHFAEWDGVQFLYDHLA